MKQQTAHQYYLFRKEEVLDFSDVKKLRRKRNYNPNEPLTYFVRIEDTFDVTKRATGRGGRDKMINELSKKYANITQEALNMFTSFYIQCQRKEKKITSTKANIIQRLYFPRTRRLNRHTVHDQVTVQIDNKLPRSFDKICILRPLTSKCAV